MNRFTPGNAVELLRSGGEYFPALIGAIAGATREVWLETYIFADDRAGEAVTAALTAAVARGVTVRVLVDGWGARHYLTAPLRRRLEQAACACSSTGRRSRPGTFAPTGCAGCTASSPTSTVP